MSNEIKLNESQKEHFSEMYKAAINDITTESAFTSELKRELVENMPNTNDIVFYQALRSQYHTAHMLRKYIENHSKKKTVKKSKKTQW